jgi:pimeloyl-ACP methyl ester carboxylesterase
MATSSVYWCLFLCLIAFILTSCSAHRITKQYAERKFNHGGLKDHLVTIDAFQIEYWDSESEKPPIVLVHGFGTSPTIQWFRQVKALSETHRVIVPNLLYFGDSRPIGLARYELQSQVDLVKALLKYLEIESYVLCGVSYGGLVAGEVARQSETQIEKLILFDAPLKFYGQADIDHVCKTYDVSKIQDFFVPYNHRGLKKLIRAGFYRAPPIPSPFLRSIYDAQYKPVANDLRQLLIKLQSEEEKYATMEYNFTFPMLILWGAHDDIVRINRGQEMRAYFPTSQFASFEKSKHFPNIEQHRKFNQTLTSFLNEGSE